MNTLYVVVLLTGIYLALCLSCLLTFVLALMGTLWATGAVKHLRRKIRGPVPPVCHPGLPADGAPLTHGESLTLGGIEQACAARYAPSSDETGEAARG